MADTSENHRTEMDANMNDGHSDELSPHQTEILLNFQELTRLEDLEQCKNLLIAQNWNFEEAVRYHFHHEQQHSENGSNNIPSSTVNDQQPNASVNYSHNDDNRATSSSNQPANQLTLFNFIPRLITFSLHTIYTSIIRVIRFAWSLINPDPRRFAADPLEDVTSFKSTYETKYGQAHPTFYLGTYSQALSDAKKELKFLLVYLHSDDHQDTDEFCRQILSHQEVINYVNRNNLLFWACSVNLGEGYRVSQALHENTYPFMALIVLKETRMTVVRRFEGKQTVERLLSQLQHAIENNQESLIVARLERQERDMTHMLRKQQDEAYYESLKIDQEKERKKREEQRLKDEAVKVKKQRELFELNRKERIKKLRALLKSKIPDEPTDADNGDAIKLSIKLPHGQRLERKFLKNESMKHLYYFVFANDEHLVNFQIVTNFPRRELPGRSPRLIDLTDEQLIAITQNNYKDAINNDCNYNTNNDEIKFEDVGSNIPTFAEFGLGRSEMLFVHDLEA